MYEDFKHAIHDTVVKVCIHVSQHLFHTAQVKRKPGHDHGFVFHEFVERCLILYIMSQLVYLMIHHILMYKYDIHLKTMYSLRTLYSMKTGYLAYLAN